MKFRLCHGQGRTEPKTCTLCLKGSLETDELVGLYDTVTFVG